ncbi:MAG: tRNA pseudouridine(38-40) synthase TruA [Acidimicrobiales bacterium]
MRIRMKVAYDGGGFRGFAAQPGVTTVAGALADALHSVIGHPVQIICAGRTDAGVHAAGQVIHFDLHPERARDAYAGTAPDTVAIRRSLNRMLAPAVVVKEAGLAPAGFDARRSAQWRRYRYLVLNQEDPDPFLAATTWHVEAPLDLRGMQLACDPIHGEHDFAAFCRQPLGDGSTVRVVTRAEWVVVSPLFVAPPGRRARPDRSEGRGAADGGRLLAFEIVAGSFCQQMVRSLVGTMVDMGRGRKTAGDMAWILRSLDRGNAASPAPPQGLCLEEVGYPAFPGG